MTASTRSSRRQLATVVMLVLALVGGLVRWLAPQPSVARDLGSLLMVLWLPIVGNIIGWLIQRAKAPRHVLQGFAADAAFEPSARIELTLLAADTPRESRPIRAGYFDGALVVGSEGFTTRLAVPVDGEPVPEVPCVLAVQFLRPALALARLAPGERFTLLAGRRVLGTGHVLPAAPADDPRTALPVAA
ncbi:MAG: hypothetical protein KXJ61_13175 [Hydrogenophaga sp.]|uniref:hypothetical protein n=1 Tax=Hydrogenophaga sp. TaxID=1904254 RepID=UPI001D479AEF|nr:hypothetical protein [Hydrogenophaga sp.]MBW0171165.1 hypothetical protein [Hydrogenophaga sp.]MBW0184598.1 hypothetical protein [Hydrogenophaga sp.]